MRISIITVTLDSERHLGQTMECALRQTSPPDEYIIIDGGSRDSTLEIANRYARDYPGVVKVVSEKDKGIYDAMNKGIRLAAGELIGIINSDDYYCQGVLAQLRSALSGGRPPDVIHGDMYRRYDFDGQGILVPSKPPNPEARCEEMPLHHPACFIARQAYERFGLYDERFRSAGDLDLILRFAGHGASFQRLDSFVSCFRPGGLTTTHFWLSIWEQRRVWQLFRGTWPGNRAFLRRAAMEGSRWMKIRAAELVCGSSRVRVFREKRLKRALLNASWLPLSASGW